MENSASSYWVAFVVGVYLDLGADDDGLDGDLDLLLSGNESYRWIKSASQVKGYMFLTLRQGGSELQERSGSDNEDTGLHDCFLTNGLFLLKLLVKECVG